MDALGHNSLLAPNIILTAEDEMMDSDYDNTIQQHEDDYDIDIDAADAYSNAGMDEEMKFDTGDDGVIYDNDDLMLDDADYQTNNIGIPSEEIELVDIQQSEASNIVSVETSAIYDTKVTGFVEVQAEDIPPIVALESLNQFQAEPQLATDAGTDEHSVLAEGQRVEEAPGLEQQVTGKEIASTAGPEDEVAEAIAQESLGGEQNVREATHAIETESAIEAYSAGENSEGLSNEADATTEQNEATSHGSHGVESPQTMTSKVHPIVVHFETNTLSLFNPESYIDYTAPSGAEEQSVEAYPEIPSMYLINDASSFTKGFDEVFASLREMFADDIGEDPELTVEIDELELFLHEDNLLSKSISLSELIDLHIRLCKQDGIEKPHPMYITLATQPRFTKRYSELLSAAGQGKGISQIRTYSPVEEYQLSLQEHQGQSVQDTPTASANSPHGDREEPQFEHPTDLETSSTHEQLEIEEEEPSHGFSEAQDDFVVIGAEEVNDCEGEAEDKRKGEAEEKVEEAGVETQQPVEAEDNHVVNFEPMANQVPSNQDNSENEAEASETTEVKIEVFTAATEVSVEEIADENAHDVQTPEEVYEPEGSVHIETRSVTEISETVRDEEELLEYEEEEEVTCAVGFDESLKQPDDGQVTPQSVAQASPVVSNEAEEITVAPSDSAAAEDGSRSEVEHGKEPINGTNTIALEEPQQIQVYQFDDGDGHGLEDTGHSSNQVHQYDLATWDERDLPEHGENYTHGEPYNEDFEGVDNHSLTGGDGVNSGAENWDNQETYQGLGGDEGDEYETSGTVHGDDGSKYRVFVTENDDLTVTDPPWYSENGQRYEFEGEYEGEEQYEDTQGQYEEAEEQYDQAKGAEGEFDGANEGKQASEQYLHQPSVSKSPSAKRLREYDDIDSQDVQHIKRSRSN